MSLFTSTQCDVCRNALQQAFGGIEDQRPETIPHHRTKDSLVDSVMVRNCHLCRLVLYHLKLHWICPLARDSFFASAMLQNPLSLKWDSPFWAEEEAEKWTPETLTEADFAKSDFNFKTFSKDRIVVRSYLLGLPERLELGVIVSKYKGPTKGIIATLQFDSEALSQDSLSVVKPSFWIFDGTVFSGVAKMARLNDDMYNPVCRELLRSWLKDCDNSHDACGSLTQRFLPTRLLDLGDVDAKQRVRVVLSQDLDPNTSYVSLSHCWGASVPFQLTTSSIAMMREGFDLAELPPTFRDAIDVARWADVRYIWIDSCCILQRSDSDIHNEWKSDWEREAKTMEYVYKNTYFNISADHSESSNGGLFTSRLAYKFTPCSLTMPMAEEIHILPQSDFTRPVTQSPISQRAWVIQERYLSPRVLHFTSDQIFWECATHNACETFPKGMPDVYQYGFQPYKVLSDKIVRKGSYDWLFIYQSIEYLYRICLQLVTYLLHTFKFQSNRVKNVYGSDYKRVWGRMCEDYSAARLTFTSDKLIAFSGMVKDFRSRYPEKTYVAGMWKEDLTESLVWSVRALDGRPLQPNGSRDEGAKSYITASPPTNYRAPSWSWLSKDCCIFWSKIRHNSRPLLEVLYVSIDLVDENDAMGDIRGGSITIRGLLRPASWLREDETDRIVLDSKSGKYLHDAPSDPSSANLGTFLIQRDVGDELPTKNIFCLPVRHSYHARSPLEGVEVIDGLILGRTGKEDHYERLGYFEANGTSFCRALLWQLQPPAKELEYPWHGLDVQSGKSASGALGHKGYYKEVQAVEFNIV